MLTAICEVERRRISIPTGILEPWAPVDPSSISCSIPIDPDNIDNNKHLEGTLIGKDLSTSSEVVTVFQRWSLLTQCRTGLFFGNSITHVFQPKPITESDIISSTSFQNFRFNPPIPDYPEPECTWLKTLTTEKVVITQRSLRVTYDIHTNTIHSALLAKGRGCSSEFCAGVDVNTMLRRDQTDSSCRAEHTEITLHLQNTGLTSHQTIYSCHGLGGV